MRYGCQHLCDKKYVIFRTLFTPVTLTFDLFKIWQNRRNHRHRSNISTKFRSNPFGSFWGIAVDQPMDKQTNALLKVWCKSKYFQICVEVRQSTTSFFFLKATSFKSKYEKYRAFWTNKCIKNDGLPSLPPKSIRNKGGYTFRVITQIKLLVSNCYHTFLKSVDMEEIKKTCVN